MCSSDLNLRKISEIIVTKNEINTIKTVKNLKNRKILFATLVLSKAIKQGKTGRNISEKNTDKFFINYSNLLDVIKLSGMKSTEIELANLFHDFGEEDLMSFYSPERESILIKFAEQDGESEIVITEPEKFMDYYKQYFGGDIIYCSN